MNRIAIRLLIILSPVFFFVSSAIAQKGYIYVHVSAVNEESAPDFQFTMSGGPTAVSDFFLNDQPMTPGRTYDIGASHGVTTNGLGDGELWASLELSGDIYHRIAGSSQWTSTGLTGTSLDGAGPGQFVNVDANGDAYFFDGSTHQVIYTAAAHSGLKAIDITWGDGRIAIVTDDGSIWKNDGSSAPYTDAWTVLATTVNASRLDMLPSSGQIVYYSSVGTVFTLPFTGGTATNIGAPGTIDVTFDDDGTIYANGYKWGGGTTWIPDITRNISFNHTTAGAGRQVWNTSAALNSAGTIYTRTPAQGIWIDDERVRIPNKGNAIILPVDAGSYTLSAIIPAGWSMDDITLYDPTANSTATISSAQATIDVTAGEVVHVIMREARLMPIAVSQACGVISTEDFGTAPAVPFDATSYHYYSNNNISDGYYTIATTDYAGVLTDHTTGAGNMMLVNGTAQQDVLYRKRLTNLLTGQPYKLSFWIANINTAAPVKPDLLAGLAGTDGVVISSFSTGPVTAGSWTVYTFTFIAPASTADVFLQNNANGSNGNDFALDDIAIIPMAGVLPSSTLTPATPGICAGNTCTIANTTSGGVWTTNNPLAATVDATGKITAVGGGYADITYTVTDGTGCQATAINTLTVYAKPTVTATAGSTSICTGGSVTLSAMADNTLPPYSYQWSSSPVAGGAIANDNLQNTTASPLAGTTYTYIVTTVDARGCTSSAATDVVAVNPPPVAAISYPADFCAAGIAMVTQTGITGGVYTGTAGLIIDAATGTVDLQASTVGMHTVTYTFSDGLCTNTATAVINIHGLPVIAAITGPAAVCEGEQIVLANTTAAGVWTSDNNTFATVNANGTATGVSAGTASIVYTVTDGYGCTNSVDATVTVNPRPTASIAYTRAVFCFTGTTDVIQTGITGGTFSTSAGLVIDATTGKLDLGASVPGTYTITYAFTNGTCSNIATTTVTVEGRPFVAPITGNNMLCIDNRGTTLSSLTPGGVWNSSDISTLLIDAAGHATGIKPGTAVITYEITTPGGCSNTTDFTMVIPPLPTFGASSTPASCSYGNDGTIIVQPPGTGYQYSLNEGDWTTNNTFTDLKPADYSVQVMNDKNCISAPEIITVQAPGPIGLILTRKDITCHGESSGSLSLTAVGGTAPYRVSWSTGATNNKIANLPAGDYSVTVTDQHGCSSSLSVTLKELFPVFVVNDPVKKEGGLLTITGEAMPRADILVTYPDGSITTTHTDGRGNFSTLSPDVVGTGTIMISVTDPNTKGTCTKYINYNKNTVADLSIIKTIAIEDAPTIGDEATFTITVNNKGLDHASQVIVTDDISNMLEDIVDITTTAGNTTFNTRTRQVIWNIDTVYVNKPVQLSFTTRISRGGLLENTAVVSGREADPDQSNNTASIRPVEISPDLYVPNVVTANGDGKNDYFVVRGIEQYPGSVLEVYNRWGNMVYHSGNYDNKWGGTGLSAGIYYYVLKINMSRTVKVYKGYIELIQK